MVEMWAHCPRCAQAFSVPAADRRRVAICPVCLTPATRSAIGVTAEAALGLLGLTGA